MKLRVLAALILCLALGTAGGINLYSQSYTKADLNAYDSEGIAAYKRGDYSKMVDAFLKSVEICEQLYGTNHAETAYRYTYLGLGYNLRGDYDKALLYNGKALKIRIDLYGEKNQDVAISYNNVAQAYKKMGDYARAISNYEKAVNIFIALLGEKHPNVATCYDNMGIVYYTIRDYDRAIWYHEKAVAIYLEVLGEKNYDTAICLNNLGSVYDAKGDYDRSLEFYLKALSIYRELLGEQHPYVMICLDNIGSVCMHKGDYDKAIYYMRSAQKIGQAVFGEDHPDMAISYDNLSGAYYRKGDYQQAILYGERALAIILKTEAEQEKVIIARNLAISYLADKKPKDAAKFFLVAIRVIEDVRKLNLSGGSDFTSRNIYAYYYAQSVYYMLKDLDSMFNVSERMRAMGYIERLSIKGAIDAAGIDPEQGKKLLRLKDDIERLTSLRSRLISVPVSQMDANQKRERDAQLEKTSKELAQAESDFNALETELMKNEKYKLLRSTSAVTVAEAQALCGKDGAIIEYVIPETSDDYMRPFAIIITAAGINAVELDASFDYSGKIEKYRKLIKDNKKKDMDALSSELYAKLIEPVNSYISAKEIKRLIIVPDGSLSFLPFDSLAPAGGKFLAERYEVTLTPSVTVSVMIKGRKYDKRDNLMAFGGGQYSGTGESSTRGESSFRGIVVDTADREKLAETSFSSPLEYYKAQQIGWADLPGTEREVSAINEKIYGKKNTEIYTGSKVSEENLKALSKNGQLKKFASIHFACHGYYDPEFPAYSAVVFSEVSGRLKNSKDDGYMSVEETALLNLQAEIVVLSACETGLGRMVNGDGVIGLTRAFQVAGSNRVLVTLWPVSDDATEAFMVSFYKKVRAGMSYREALVKVKEEFRKSEKYSAPYYWAGFVLYE